MKLSDFDFDLPEELIATRPVRPRSAARLLVAEGDHVADRYVYDLPDILRPGDRLILNDTKVIPARLIGVRHRSGEGRATTARVECLLLEPTPEGDWRAMLKPLKKVRDGEAITFEGGLSAVVMRRDAGIATLSFNLDGPAFDVALTAAGEMPLPPYIAQRRAADARDREDYQTIWAKQAGAVAAPTASLHFDAPLLSALRNRGVTFTNVTLHVGAGTFLPVKVENIADHRMHAEWGEITEGAAAELRATKAAGGRLVPVGTTALRLIETAARDGAAGPWAGKTDIFITPGFRFRVANALITNFHLPKSTLMMLVSALMGPDQIRRIYSHAIASRYRFFSYGDASILFPKG